MLEISHDLQRCSRTPARKGDPASDKKLSIEAGDGDSIELDSRFDATFGAQAAGRENRTDFPSPTGVAISR